MDKEHEDWRPTGLQIKDKPPDDFYKGKKQFMKEENNFPFLYWILTQFGGTLHLECIDEAATALAAAICAHSVQSSLKSRPFDFLPALQPIKVRRKSFFITFNQQQQSILLSTQLPLVEILAEGWNFCHTAMPNKVEQGRACREILWWKHSYPAIITKAVTK